MPWEEIARSQLATRRGPLGGGCWCAGVTHTLGVAVHSSVHHFVSGLWSRSGSLLSPRRGVVAPACGSAAPGTELNEWRRDTRSEVRTAAGGRHALRGAELRAPGSRRGLGAKVSRDKFGGGERWCGAVPGLKAERSLHPRSAGLETSLPASFAVVNCCALADF